MNLKALGLKLGLNYLLGRASGDSKKDSILSSLLGSAISQAEEDISGFTPEIKNITTQVVTDLVHGRRAKNNASLQVLSASDSDLAEAMNAAANPETGLTVQEAAKEIQELQQGLLGAVSTLSRLEQLKAGVIKRD